MQTVELTLEQVEKSLGEPALQWKGRCYEIASRIVENRLVDGHAVYGHWVGSIHPKSLFASKSCVGFCQHGWVIASDEETIVDPTRWTFEAVEPYLFIGPNDGNYDEGGNNFRKSQSRPCPIFDPAAKSFQLTLSSNCQFKVFRMTGRKAVDGALTLSLKQLHWLATTSYEDLQPYASEILVAIHDLGIGLVPIDNWRRAQRESVKLVFPKGVITP